MRILARAPLRVDFAGGWTDVPIFADRVGGAVTAAAIDHHVEVTITPQDAGIRLRALDRDERELATVAASEARELAIDGVLDLHKAAVHRAGLASALLESRSEAPVGSGLGGSGALGVALLAALSRCRGISSDAATLAEEAFQVETSDLGWLGGRQDQLCAALGGIHYFEFSSDGVEASPVALSPDALGELEAHTVLAYSGQSHFSSVTHDRVWHAFEQGDAEVTDALRRMAKLADEAALALMHEDWRRLAKVVDENWTQQRRLHPSIATERTDHLERVAREAGALGVKATGAGAGGCLLMLCESGRKEHVEEALVEAGAQVMVARYSTDGVTAEVRS